ncbi:hypothetical protein SFRURICE_002689 [Spodoptera frugiperda]|nr:hypothetical protein SFRURICE_002689 [Spodoptera frugiperda]
MSHERYLFIAASILPAAAGGCPCTGQPAPEGVGVSGRSQPDHVPIEVGINDSPERIPRRKFLCIPHHSNNLFCECL